MNAILHTLTISPDSFQTSHENDALETALKEAKDAKNHRDVDLLHARAENPRPQAELPKSPSQLALS